MRQAGRYLPEYRALRSTLGSFLDLCYSPKDAAEVTLQPIRRFGMDAAIVFSDILVIPHAMGQDVTFVEKEGPRLTPLTTLSEFESLTTKIESHLSPIAETLTLVRKQLAPEKSLIGFCGAPWTVSCYMIEGGGSRDYSSVRIFARRNEAAFSLLIGKIVEASARYLSMQVDAGADVVQLFDSWAGVLSPAEYEQWVIAPTRILVSAFKASHPDIPVIGFPRGSGVLLKRYAEETGVDAVGIDTQTPIQWAGKNLSLPFQGNLDPILFACDKNAAIAETRRILSAAQNKKFIFNLGHGILPFTPLENVEAVCNILRGGEA